MNTTTALDINTWTHPATGEIRRYINNWTDLAKVNVRYYKSGNVMGVTVDGEDVANRRAGGLLSIKVWLDEDDTLHIDDLDRGMDAVRRTNQDIGKLIREGVAAALAVEED